MWVYMCIVATATATQAERLASARATAIVLPTVDTLPKYTYYVYTFAVA
jgi:hypothetical protein